MSHWQRSQEFPVQEPTRAPTAPLPPALPRTTPVPGLPDTAPLPAAAPHTTTPGDLILVVDDSPTIRALLEASLRLAGYACRSFADGVSMLRWLWQDAPHLSCPPRLLVLDLELPGMDGYAIAHAMQANARWQQIVLVMLSGRDGVTDRLKGRLAGAQMYLTKPFRIEHLLSTVRAALAGPPSTTQGDGTSRG